jgi:proteasome accessory factor A
MIEAGRRLRDHTLENPIRRSARISHDLTGPAARCGWRTPRGQRLEIQEEYLNRRKDFVDTRACTPDVDQAGPDLWERRLRAVGDRDRARRPRDRLGHQAPARRGDTAAKHNLPLTRRGSPGSTCATTTSTAPAACTTCCAARGWSSGSARTSRCSRPRRAAADDPGQAARRLRPRAQERRRDFTVDWVHLKLNDQAQRTVLCKDPFRSVDDRVERLIQSM